MNSLCRFLLLAALMLACQPAWAERRVALVIGNSHYPSEAMLPNTAHDATALAATLKGAGFDVVDSRIDLQAADMRRALREFSDLARDADVAVVYYAGHGIEMDGTNYLIPTDARLERDTDIYDEGFSLDRVLQAIEPARQLRLVIVDACRSNPFTDKMKRTVATRSVSRGLARIEPTTTNTLVAFAAKAGFVALDGLSQNSPYAAALIKYIARPGLDLRKAFGFIRDDVMLATSNKQEPYVYGSLGGGDVALIPAAPVASARVPEAVSPSDIRRDFELAMDLNSKDAMNAFLAQHPEGYYANLARLELDKLAAEERPAPAARPAAQDQAPPATDSAPVSTNAAQPQIAATDASAKTPIAGPPAAKAQAPQLAALDAGSQQADLASSVQRELRRVGCLTAAADGEWNAASQRSLALFNKHAGTRLDVKLATAEALDAIRLRPARVCPLLCEHGFKADGDTCGRIVCAQGSVLNDDNECEKRRTQTKDVAKRDDRRDRRARAERGDRQGRADTSVEQLNYHIPGYDIDVTIPRPQAAPRRSQSQGSGQIFCDGWGCHPVARGCHIESLGSFAARATGGLGVVCN
ncbi:MAG: caspase family protein [Bradyrhizobium sp.]|uniref:caspase family protein n=1 Tax=Bradyrhizobium sp. TaxID=376 RepID=UPI001E0977EF|nr:caspase family protein [Bradyrhizobium sp.]MBV9561789.1 caspase family protein [Bradyrhizobium sp.]